jgi:uncharacterized protein YxjI
MNFKIRQKIFSFGDNFTVSNEYGEPILIVKGKVFSLGDKLRIYDPDMNEMFYIEQKIFRFLPEYRIYQGGSEVAFLKKEFTFFKPKINIQSRYGNFCIEGSILQHNFTIYNSSQVVATVSKKFLSLTDEYNLEVLDEKNASFLITLVIVIDQILHDSNNNGNH